MFNYFLTKTLSNSKVRCLIKQATEHIKKYLRSKLYPSQQVEVSIITDQKVNEELSSFPCESDKDD